MMLKNRRGDVSKQVAMIMAGVIVAMALLAHFIRNGVMGLSSFYGTGPEMRKLIRQWRQEADFILTGEIVGIREKINEQVNVSDDPAMSYLIIDVRVDSVERARKHIDEPLQVGDKVPIYFGWYSPEGGDEYPPTLRQDYRRGNFVKLYVNYDEYRFGFYSPGAYYTIEPLN